MPYYLVTDLDREQEVSVGECYTKEIKIIEKYLSHKSICRIKLIIADNEKMWNNLGIQKQFINLRLSMFDHVATISFFS